MKIELREESMMSGDDDEEEKEEALMFNVARHGMTLTDYIKHMNRSASDDGDFFGDDAENDDYEKFA